MPQSAWRSQAASLSAESLLLLKKRPKPTTTIPRPVMTSKLQMSLEPGGGDHVAVAQRGDGRQAEVKAVHKTEHRVFQDNLPGTAFKAQSIMCLRRLGTPHHRDTVPAPAYSHPNALLSAASA